MTLTSCCGGCCVASMSAGCPGIRSSSRLTSAVDGLNRSGSYWEPGQQPALCAEDPCLVETRYVYVEAEGAALQPISHGLLDWANAIREGSVHLYGDPELVRDLPRWFGGTGRAVNP